MEIFEKLEDPEFIPATGYPAVVTGTIDEIWSYIPEDRRSSITLYKTQRNDYCQVRLGGSSQLSHAETPYFFADTKFILRNRNVMSFLYPVGTELWRISLGGARPWDLEFSLINLVDHEKFTK